MNPNKLFAICFLKSVSQVTKLRVQTGDLWIWKQASWPLTYAAAFCFHNFYFILNKFTQVKKPIPNNFCFILPFFLVVANETDEASDFFLSVENKKINHFKLDNLFWRQNKNFADFCTKINWLVLFLFAKIYQFFSSLFLCMKNNHIKNLDCGLVFFCCTQNIWWNEV